MKNSNRYVSVFCGGFGDFVCLIGELSDLIVLVIRLSQDLIQN